MRDSKVTGLQGRTGDVSELKERRRGQVAVGLAGLARQAEQAGTIEIYVKRSWRER